MSYLLRRLAYYVVSVVVLLRGVRNWPILLALLRHSGVPRVVVLADGTKYAVRSLMDMWIIKETNLDRDYERFGVSIQDGWTIVDIGAGLGDFTVFAARRAPHGYVYAYEPAPDSVELLKENLSLNNITNVQVHQLAVSDKAGVLALDISHGVAVQYRTTRIAIYGNNSAHVTVQSISLAEVLEGLPGGSCDFLKIDVEGAEYEMLLSLGEGSLQRIRRICLEYHKGVTEYSPTDLEHFFVAHGWHVQVHPSAVRPELGFLYAENPIPLSV